jgi:signal transduction histidine kinase
MIDIVVRNLMANAVKFTQPHGSIDVFLEIKDSLAEVIIRDTGIGVFDSPIEKITDFGKLEVKTGTKGEKGIGLGLTVCDEFVIKNHGRLWLEYSSSKGSDFRFTLPIKPL